MEIKELINQQYKRALFIEPQINEEDRTLVMSFSSEVPYERGFGFEILDHSSKSVNMDRLNAKAPLLLDHDHTKQIGVIQRAWIENQKGYVEVKFSRGSLGDEVFRDVLDGIRSNVSVGYEVIDMIADEPIGGTKAYRVINWFPHEVSVVSVPADYSVGVGRSKDLEEREIIKDLNMEEIKEVETPKDEIKSNETPTVDVKAIENSARKAEQERIREILSIGDRFNKKSEANEAINKGTSLDMFRKTILEGFNVENTIETQKSAEIGLNERELRNYSFGRALRASITGDWKGAEFELEASRAVEKALGKSAVGFYVPHDVLKREVTVAGTGANIVDDVLMGGSFIEILRNKMALAGMGAKMLTGLAGDITIPKQTGSASTYWVDESGSTTASDITLSNIKLSPKTVSAKTSYSRQMLLQGNPSVDSLVMSDLASVIALELDRAGIAGTGASSQPTGILSTTGIGAVDLSAGATYAKIVEFETDVKSVNADLNTLKFLMNASTAGKLKTTEKTSGYPQYLLEGGMLNGYNVTVSNQVADSTILFGDFSQLIIGLWGGLDIITERDINTGGYAISAFQSVDFGVRHAESFSASTNLA